VKLFKRKNRGRKAGKEGRTNLENAVHAKKNWEISGMKGWKDRRVGEHYREETEESVKKKYRETGSRQGGS